jgi:ABC-2 type transport system ATP-binding protein
MQACAVEVNGLRKSYGGKPAVDGISFTVRRGEVFGLLGPNGAGKTTTLECLEGIRRPDGGAVRVLGVDPWREPRRLRQVIGVQLESSALPATIRVDEAMRVFSAYHQVPPRYDLLERMGLGGEMKAQYYALSTGQKRRLALALAVAHRPPVVLLDEPTAGLEVAARAELHRLVRELKEGGASVILSTHDMAEAEVLADEVAILLRGRIAATGTPREITAAGAGLTKITVRTSGSSLEGDTLPAVAREGRVEDYRVYYSTKTGSTVAAIINRVETAGDELLDLRVERPSLEERFLELTTQGVL